MTYFEKLTDYIKGVKRAQSKISKTRIELLDHAAGVLSDFLQQKDQVEAIFICTHNSRRSHLSQIWAQLAAWEFGLPIKCYSGGTEATAFYPSAVAALVAAGCRVSREGEHNPHYIIQASEERSITSFSKKFDDNKNPQSGFIAFMTCSDADINCPIVPGASARISLYYDDPKAFDGTDLEEEKYAERCFQIASEMYYMMSMVHRS